MLDKQYNPAGVEERWYTAWRDSGAFTGVIGGDKDDAAPFTIVIPPPNVTGALHMGHALNNTLQDVLIRRARMQGRPTLWVPGTDHAGIATQNAVEKRLGADEGITRHDLGRDAFVERVWEWKDHYETRILGQLARMGCSLDWSRTRFTMDEGLSRAVRTVFVRLYEDGLIYRGNRIINWCPRCTTALSDIEVRHEEVPGELVTLTYPLADGSGAVQVATTRVETMLGDTGVAVHPEDERYKALIGKTVKLPLMDREIPIVGDDAVDPEFGTGAVKVTPAHDQSDFEIAQRQGLPAINIFDKAGVLTAEAGRFAGLDRFEARVKVRDALAELGLVVHEERPYMHSVGHCDRCNTVVEPWLSEQWFVKMRELADPAIEAVRDGRVRIHPQVPFERVYTDWMSSIRDWCISRQLWWGHRIPVWTCADGHQFAALEDPNACAECGSAEIEQDPDVLDTWFSSWLWPFSTLGWPERTEDLKYWYPTSVLVTGYDILYLWVARMIMSGLRFMGEVPFADVVLTGLVRDAQGRKLSKLLGNAIDPIEVFAKYGTDAVRFTLVSTAVPGQDTNLAEEWIEGSRNFCNKLWNAARFVLGNLDGEISDAAPTGLPERWILSRLGNAIRTVDDALAKFDFSEAGRALQRFIRSEFCDWYLETAKLGMQSAPEVTRGVLRRVLETSLRLAHPVMPFITEEIWQRLQSRGDATIMLSAWPTSEAPAHDAEAEAGMDFLQEAVTEIRRFRHEHNLAPKERIEAVLVGTSAQRALAERYGAELSALAWLSEIQVADAAPDGRYSKVVAAGADIYLPLGTVDVGAERARLQTQIAEAASLAGKANAKLGNPAFVDKAPDDVVAKVRDQLAEHEGRIAKLQAQLDELS